MNEIRIFTDLIHDNLRALFPQAENYSIITFLYCTKPANHTRIIAQAILYTNDEQTKWRMIMRGYPAATLVDAYRGLLETTQREMNGLIERGSPAMCWNGSGWEDWEEEEEEEEKEQ
ncbi:hypothetical protein N0V83_007178 [Neocucurbitaria cava]|uniref:Uncharacterized protein n=1 Tax=Neocucurbitaria cava TaxID=798079 RepID=A0A9W8Y5L7_9PLEO|nr:hypothetical protein N0V83_007178 [Neocucurbitaria cava]